jgi:hypothetical protein
VSIGRFVVRFLSRFFVGATRDARLRFARRRAEA